MKEEKQFWIGGLWATIYWLMVFGIILSFASCSSKHTVQSGRGCENSFNYKPKIKENYNSRGTNWW